MGSRWLSRLAVATAAAGALTLAVASTAAAHTDPAEGFNAVLHKDHHDSLAEDFADCEEVRKDNPDLIKEGFDVWVFNIPEGQFDTEAEVTLRVTFQDLSDEDVVVEVPGEEFDWWIGPEANQHLVAVVVPAGWTLLDGDANVVDSDHVFVVTHTCPGVPESPPPTTPESPPPSNGNGNGSTPPGNGGTTPAGGGGGLPVTGPPTSGIVLAGIGLLAAGLALMAVRRRRDISDLTEG